MAESPHKWYLCLSYSSNQLRDHLQMIVLSSNLRSQPSDIAYLGRLTVSFTLWLVEKYFACVKIQEWEHWGSSGVVSRVKVKASLHFCLPFGSWEICKNPCKNSNCKSLAESILHGPSTIPYRKMWNNDICFYVIKSVLLKRFLADLRLTVRRRSERKFTLF